jgi:hypothetical protein
MTIEMIAAKRFRLPVRGWVDPGDPYTVDTEKSAGFHEKTGRGKRAEVEPTPVKSGKAKGA